MQGGAEKSMQRRDSGPVREKSMQRRASESIREKSMQRHASESIEISVNERENERELELDDADVEKLLKELGQLYKQRSASKSIKKSEKW